MKIICTLDCEDVPDISENRLTEAVLNVFDFGCILVASGEEDDPDAVSVTNITVEVQR